MELTTGTINDLGTDVICPVQLEALFEVFSNLGAFQKLEWK